MAAAFICGLILIMEKAMLHKLKITSYALIILLILVLPSQADEYCTTADMCAAAAQAAGKMLGNQGKNGISGYPFVLETNTYGCWYYPDSHANKNYAGSAFWGAASSEAQMRDPDPGDAHHVRLKCEGGGPAPEAQLAAEVDQAMTEEQAAAVAQGLAKAFAAVGTEAAETQAAGSVIATPDAATTLKHLEESRDWNGLASFIRQDVRTIIDEGKFQKACESSDDCHSQCVQKAMDCCTVFNAGDELGMECPLMHGALCATKFTATTCWIGHDRVMNHRPPADDTYQNRKLHPDVIHAQDEYAKVYNTCAFIKLGPIDVDSAAALGILGHFACSREGRKHKNLIRRMN